MDMNDPKLVELLKQINEEQTKLNDAFAVMKQEWEAEKKKKQRSATLYVVVSVLGFGFVCAAVYFYYTTIISMVANA